LCRNVGNQMSSYASSSLGVRPWRWEHSVVSKRRESNILWCIICSLGVQIWRWKRSVVSKMSGTECLLMHPLFFGSSTLKMRTFCCIETSGIKYLVVHPLCWNISTYLMWPFLWSLHKYKCFRGYICFLEAPYTLSVKLRDFTVWPHTWQKNWANCAVLTGNCACLRTVLSSRLSHTELRSSHRKSYSFLIYLPTPWWHHLKGLNRTDKKLTTCAVPENIQFSFSWSFFSKQLNCPV
jgi:hypothetical protein